MNKYQIATGVAILLHAAGLAGIFFFDKAFFLNAAPYYFMIMFLLILLTQKIRTGFLLFFAACYLIGMAAEVWGVHTELLFGKYEFGAASAPAYRGVPFFIGLHWFIIIYCCGITVNTILEKLSVRLAEMTGSPSKSIRTLSVISDGAMLAVFFDWVMQPAAIKLGYIVWFGSGDVPLYNYVCRLVISALLLVAFAFLKFEKRNAFAVNLLLMMMMFYMVLRTVF